MTEDAPKEDIAEFSRSLDEAPSYSKLARLSGLSSDELGQFKLAWVSLPAERRREIIGRLVELGEENVELSFFEVFQACLNDDEEEVRAGATRGLWECDDRAIIRPLIGLIDHDPSNSVRAASATTLGKFATLAQDGKLHPRDGGRLRDSLLEAIRREGQDPSVVRRAIEAVGALGGPEVDGVIGEAYESADLKLRQGALFAMGRSSEPKWLPKVLQELSHTDPAIRYEAATASGLLGDESTVPELTELADDEDPQVQLAAISALGEIGGPLAKRALMGSLEIGDKTLEEAARDALANLEFNEDPLGLSFSK